MKNLPEKKTWNVELAVFKEKRGVCDPYIHAKLTKA